MKAQCDIQHCRRSRVLVIGLGESSFLRLEYCVEFRIEYSSTQLIPEVAINYRVTQQTGIWFLIQVRNTIAV